MGTEAPTSHRAADAPRSGTGQTAPLTGPVDVIVDGSGRLGALSYNVPPGLEVRVGDAVGVPFGKRSAYGLVVGPGDQGKATRSIEACFGRRVEPADVDFAASLARSQFSSLRTIAPRLAPKNHKGADPTDPGPVELTEGTAHRVPALASTLRRLHVCAPLIDFPDVAAVEAAQIASAGQVLVLCPTLELVHAVMARFRSGAVRLDAKAPRGAWAAFASGAAPIGVGTRAAALFSAPKLTGIVVVDEGNPAHREAQHPHTNARDVAIARTRQRDGQLALISACPSPQALAAGVKAHVVGSSEHWPTMLLTSRRPGDLGAVPSDAVTRVRTVVKGGGEALVVTASRTPQWRCSGCGTPNQQVEDTTSIRTTTAPPCERCGGQRAWFAGWDQSRADRFFAPGVRVVAAADLREQHDADLVVLADLDAALRIPSLLPDAPVANLVTEGARATRPGGTVVGVTSQPGEDVLGDLFHRHDLMAVAKRTWAAAKANRLAPFSAQVTLIFNGPRPDRAASTMPGRVLGPSRRGRDWELLVTIDRDQLHALAPHVERLRRQGKLRVTVE